MPGTIKYLRKKTIVQFLSNGLDRFLNNTTLLMHMNGTGVDVCGHAITETSMTYSAGDNAKFGSFGASFDGSSSYYTLPNSSDFNFGTEDFTIEGWFKLHHQVQDIRNELYHLVITMPPAHLM